MIEAIYGKTVVSPSVMCPTFNARVLCTIDRKRTYHVLHMRMRAERLQPSVGRTVSHFPRSSTPVSTVMRAHMRSTRNRVWLQTRRTTLYCAARTCCHYPQVQRPGQDSTSANPSSADTHGVGGQVEQRWLEGALAARLRRRRRLRGRRVWFG